MLRRVLLKAVTSKAMEKEKAAKIRTKINGSKMPLKKKENFKNQALWKICKFICTVFYKIVNKPPSILKISCSYFN